MRSYCKGLVVDEAVVRRGYEEWAATQAGRKNSWRVPVEHGSADELVAQIAREVRDGTLAFAPIEYREEVEGSNGKLRLIGVESVKQQVAEHVVICCIRPLYEARLWRYQCAGVKGRGQTYAARALRRWCDEPGARYWAKSDIRKCYQSIDHASVYSMYAKYVRSADLLYMISAILASFGERGLNLGGHFSLVTANLLLSFAYHRVEGLGKRRRGRWCPAVSHQLWYMDDFVLFGRDKNALKSAMREVARLLGSMSLEIKPWKVCRVGEAEPIDMVGYVVRPGRTTVRARTFLRARRAVRRLKRAPCLKRAQRVCSYWGYFKNSDSYLVCRRIGAHEAVAAASRLVRRAAWMEAAAC